MTRLGLVGTGAWGQKIALTVDTIPGARVTAIVTRPGKASPAFPFEFRAYPSFEELLTHNLDGLIIATPASTHAQLYETALKTRLPTFIEKPFTTNYDDAVELSRQWKAAGQPLLLVNHVQLFNPDVIDLAQLVRRRGGAEELRFTHHNWGPFRSDCSALWDYGAHSIALALMLTGIPNDGTILGVDNPHTVPGAMGGYVETTVLRLLLRGVSTRILTGNGLAEKRLQYTIQCKDRVLAEFDDTRFPKIHVADSGIILPIRQDDKTSPLTAALKAFVNTIRTKEAPEGDTRFGIGLPTEVTRLLNNCDQYLLKRGIARPQARKAVLSHPTS